MAESGAECHTCGRLVTGDAPAVRAYRRVEVEPEEDDVPDLRGAEAVFHQECAPDWGDPAWISRAEGPLVEIATES
jgi:hypothetical protein